LSSEQRSVSTQLTKIEARGRILDIVNTAVLTFVGTLLVAVVALDYPRAIFGGMLKNAIEQHDRMLSESKSFSDVNQRVIPTKEAGAIKVPAELNVSPPPP
jgi:hypothetical protein